MKTLIATLLAAFALVSPVQADTLAVAHEPLYEAVGTQKGVVLVLHAGGWTYVGPEYTAGTADDARRFAALGWTAVNLDYRAGADGLTDAVAATEWALRTYPEVPLCLYGESSGGHLALVAAARVSGVTCVFTQGAVVDPSGLPADQIGAWARGYFGDEVNTTASPTWLAEEGRYRDITILVEHGVDDVLPGTFAQAEHFCALAGRCQLDAIRPGSEGFVHGYGDPGDLAQVRRDEEGLLATGRVARIRPAPPSPPVVVPLWPAPPASPVVPPTPPTSHRCSPTLTAGVNASCALARKVKRRALARGMARVLVVVSATSGRRYRFQRTSRRQRSYTYRARPGVWVRERW